MTALASMQKKINQIESQKTNESEDTTGNDKATVESPEKAGTAARVDEKDPLKEDIQLIYRKLSDENDYIKKRLQMQY